MHTHSNKITLIHDNCGVRLCAVTVRYMVMCGVRHFNSCSVRGVRSSVWQCVWQCVAAGRVREAVCI
jgi:hypothetical protein